MCVYREEMTSGGVAASNHKVCADMALISEEVLLQLRHDSHDARLPFGGESMELDVGRDEGGGKLGVGSCTSSCTPDLRCNEMKLLAVLRRC